MQIEPGQQQLQLRLREADVDQGQRDRMERQVPGREPRVLPLVRHRDHVVVDQVVPAAVPDPGIGTERVGAVLGQPPLDVVPVVLLAPQHPGQRLPDDVSLVVGQPSVASGGANGEAARPRQPSGYFGDLGKYLTVEGVRAEGAKIETGTFLAAAAATGGEITLHDTDAGVVEAVIERLREAGAAVEASGRAIHLQMKVPPRSVHVHTAPYPGFPTGMQAQLMALLGLAEGESKVTETIFENRFMHALELARLGADIETSGNTAIVRGVKRLQGTTVMATDLRASASLVIGGLVADGETVVDRIYHLDRGYEAIESKLSVLGARIRRIK